MSTGGVPIVNYIDNISQSDYLSTEKIRRLESYKEEIKIKKKKKMQESQNVRNVDPLDHLWMMLDEQDDELIQAESC